MAQTKAQIVKDWHRNRLVFRHKTHYGYTQHCHSHCAVTGRRGSRHLPFPRTFMNAALLKDTQINKFSLEAARHTPLQRFNRVTNPPVVGLV